MSDALSTGLKKVTIFYTPSFRGLLREMGASAIDLKPAMRQVERFVSIVNNLCVFGPELAMSFTRNFLETAISRSYKDRFEDPELISKIGDSSRVEIRISHETGARIMAEAVFFKSAQKKLVLFDAMFKVEDGSVVSTGLVATDWL